MDLSKLTPAPWCGPRITDDFPPGFVGVYEEDEEGPVPFAKLFITGRFDDEVSLTNAEFIALARNAFDVMMRRGWHAKKLGDFWAVMMGDRFFNQSKNGSGFEFIHFPDPFTALVEADKWYRENVGAKRGD